MDTQFSILIESDENYNTVMNYAIANNYKWIGNVLPFDLKPQEKKYYINFYNGNMDLTSFGINPTYDIKLISEL